MAHPVSFRFLLSGLDTVEVCYYLSPLTGCQIDFFDLRQRKEALRESKRREVAVLTLAETEFLLRPYGSRNGYPLVIENADYVIEFGEFNQPSFRVKFRSNALWHKGAQAMHMDFMAWAQRAGFAAHKPESLSRVDFTFDYELAAPDFDEDSVVSLATKDSHSQVSRPSWQTLTSFYLRPASPRHSKTNTTGRQHE